ncbi:cytidine deaminase-like protein [Achaetomium macrosporum]|uniref:Cytidine deaminase n=1 Tax=Achaetomium macrosporum TaxID=79813 RepID=A0AAN7C7F6_9PEZI|nr:cytidine deaminase-like protein [Achaetomium macrosporum]
MSSSSSSAPPILSSSSSASDVSATCAAHNLTESEFHALREQATAAKSRAYCPYSGFRVGAVLLTRNGEYIPGANVENASYPVTTCAERVAFGRAVVDGHRDFKAVAVATDSNQGPASPCGMCRQCIREFCELKTPIIMFDKKSNFTVMRLEELLPLSFGPSALGVPEPSKS